MIKDFYYRKSVHPKEEDIAFEFKGHRSLIDDEVPRLSKEGDRPCRQPVSKYACGMINSRKGGIIHLGVLDDGTIEGVTLTKFQQDHIRISVQDMFNRYEPRVPMHLYHVMFKPVIDELWELKAIRDFNDQYTCPVPDRTTKHMIQTLSHCWCDADANAAFSHGRLNPSYIVEIWIYPWDSSDERNLKLFQVHNTVRPT